ncbi:MAG: NifU family protein [Flavobacteriales bacterium]|nr:NifU family protein [Flavobacteriales bacterium]
MSEDIVEITRRVEAALNELKPFLEADGGDMELVEITDDLVVRVRLLGACRTCAMSAMTMKAGLEESIKRTVPQITKVEAIDLELVHAK